MQKTLQITNTQIASDLGNQAKLGTLFAFFDKSLFEANGQLSWMSSFTSDRGPRLVSLLDVHGSNLPGVNLEPLELKLDLGVILSDKALYREGHDTVNLSVLDPLRPSMSRTLVLELQGSEYRRIPIRLNSHGMTTVPLNGLPVGQYSVRFQDGGQVHPISFTVAEYRLAPLVATLSEKKMENFDFNFSLNLETFGLPVEGEVQLELLTKGERVKTLRVQCKGGKLIGTFALKGEGPFSLNVQLVDDPSKTATVPLSGTRAAEREPTIFGRLGNVIQGSLLPTPASTPPVRGLHLEEAGLSNSPFALQRIDEKRATLTARSHAESLTVVLADPAVRQERKITAQHPEHHCAAYRHGKELFRAQEYAAARKTFQDAQEEQQEPHPYYSYYIACCYARLDRKSEAMAWLRQSVKEGWTDWQHLSEDEDLQNLRQLPEYQLLCQGGRRQLVFEKVESGQTFEIEVPCPLAFLAVGAYVNGKPFEAWSFLLPPSELGAEIIAKEIVEPGEVLEIEVRGPEQSGVLLTVKDTRLQTQDTANSKLASQLKDCVERAKEIFPPHTQPENFGSLRSLSTEVFNNLFDDHSSDSLFSETVIGSALEPGLRRGLVPRPGIATGLPASSSPARGGRVLRGLTSRPTLSARSTPALESLAESEFFCEAPSLDLSLEDAFYDGDEDLFGGEALFDAPESEAATVPAQESKAATKKTAKTAQEEPEVLYHGVLETRDGKVLVKIKLPDNFGDYLLEATVFSGLDWQTLSKSCQVKADPYVSLEVPPFVHPKDDVTGRILTSPGAKVELLLDGKAHPVDEEQRFKVLPGLYRVTVTSEKGVSRTQERRVNAPGRLKRLVQSVQILRQGQILCRQTDPSIQGIKVLPGLKKPFKLLVEATADYAHLCCEQTAAKMMSATLMALSGDPKGEAIFIAGTHRMETMMLSGGGFSMYPGRGGLDTYWGPKAVMYLLGLKGLAGRPQLSKPFSAALERCLQMAENSRSVYGLKWPSAQLRSCQDAYWSLREAKDSQALPFVTKFLETQLNRANGKVQFRAEASYAAATLLMSKTHIDQALELANQVFEELDGGRLYSTYDSVAAIVLMNELRRAGIGAGDGVVKIADKIMTTIEAMNLHEIESIRCEEKLCLVQVSKIVEEDWEQFDATVPMQLTLEKGGRRSSNFQPGDAIDLKIKLEQGYEVGDLVWVCLPDCLSRVMGGGQVKKFSVDFEGLDSVTIPLAATGRTGEKPQHFAVCVRNMFEEERVGNPGLMTVRVHN